MGEWGMSGAYYNENDPFAASWLRELIKAGMIAPGDVDERSIVDVKPEDLRGYTQCHFFAGIGGWSYALRLAGWGDERPVWTGSCPCQSFSTAGKRSGFDDPRHLWPVWFNLIRECLPPIVFGEQVASSLITGSTNEVDDLYQVLGRKAVFDVLLQSEGILPECLQELRECSTQQTQTCELCGRSFTRAWEDTGIGSTIQSKQIQSSVQSGGSRYSGENCSGILRVNGDRIRSEDSKGMERSIIRSDKARNGLYERERPGGLICSECHGTQLGAFVNPEDSGCDPESYSSCIERLVKEAGRGFEKEPSTWLSTVQSDMAGIGYSFGASVLTAAGVGAPHRRQRLYFIAEQLPGALETSAGRDGQRILGAGESAGQGIGIRVGDNGVAESHQYERRQKCADGRGIGEGSRAEGLEQRFVRGGNECVADSERPAAEPGRTTIESRESDGAAGAGTSTESGRRCDISKLAHSPDLRRLERWDSTGVALQGERAIGSGEHPQPEHGRELSRGLEGLRRTGSSMDNAPSPRRDPEIEGTENEARDETRVRGFECGCEDGGVGNAKVGGSGSFDWESESGDGQKISTGRPDIPNFWANALWLPCRDGKLRPVEPIFKQMVDGSTESLGRVCDGDISEVEKEIIEYAATAEIDAREALHDLWSSLTAEALSSRRLGRLRGVYEASVLLAFMRQLSYQGWAFSESISRASEKTQEAILRGMWEPKQTPRSSCGRGLDEQQTRESSDSLCVLSSILARYAQKAWGETFDYNARATHPLIVGAVNRVGRLRGYGNAIVPQVAAAFIEAYLEVSVR